MQEYIKAVVIHAQAVFLHPSLGTKIHLKVSVFYLGTDSKSTKVYFSLQILHIGRFTKDSITVHPALKAFKYLEMMVLISMPFFVENVFEVWLTGMAKFVHLDKIQLQYHCTNIPQSGQDL